MALIDEPDLSTRQFLEYVKGPDFPTGGILVGGDKLIEAYETGRSILTLRATVMVEDAGFGKTKLIISDIPYQSDKSTIIEKIVEAVEEEKVEGIGEIRDESDRQGLRVVLELKRGAEPQRTLVQLYDQTPLETSVSVILLALVDGRPETLTLKKALQYYLDHRREVVTRRSSHQLKKAQERQHIVDGLIRAVDILDDVIALIRGSRNRAEAHDKLVESLEFTPAQAAAILNLRLHRLTSLELTKLESEAAELEETTARLSRILDDASVLWEVVRQELKELKGWFGDERRTQIAGPDEAEMLRLQEAVPEEDIVIVVTTGGHIKQVTPETYRRNVRQNNDGFG
jgi:DNA gyrase subunit A